MLSVSGARGIVGRSMTPEVAARFAAAFGSWLLEQADDRSPRVCIGRDGRASGDQIGRGAIEGLTACGCDVIDLGVVTTPTTGLMISTLGCDGGMCITASHNPIQWNGLKCLDRDGVAPPPAIADTIIERFRRSEGDELESTRAGTCTTDSTATEAHVQRVKEAVDIDSIRSAGFTVVLDSVNASGSEGGRRLMETLGVGLVHLNSQVSGEFAHTPEPIRENLGSLCEATADDERAHCGFAQDPDADRLAIVDENGMYIGEEYTLVIAAMSALRLWGPTVLATNLSTSRMIDDVAALHPGARVQRTAVGEANVVEAIKRDKGHLGGEGNGGVILPRVCFVRDSLSSMALVLDHMAATGLSISELVGSVPSYSMIKTKLQYDPAGDDMVQRMLDDVAIAFKDAQVDRTDGVRIDLEQGWVHLRASNTEPVIRLIAEATSTTEAEALRDRVAEVAGLGS